MNTIRLLFTIALASAVPRCAHAAPWGLPQTLSDQNASITFEVDSTWHLVRGTTSGVEGKIWLTRPSDYRTISAELALPVAKFDTENSSRDERLREVMAAQQHPNVHFRLAAVDDLCPPAAITESSPCAATLRGEITIRDVTARLTIPASISIQNSMYVVKGRHVLRWADFGVEDPSILIAKLDNDVAFEFTLRWPGN